MEKIVVCGSCCHEAVLQRYKGCGAQIDFDVPCAALQIKYDYSAAFFMPDCGDDVLRAWVGNEHLRLCADENALFAEMDFFFGIPQPLEIERKFLIARPAESVLSALDFCDYADISQAYIMMKACAIVFAAAAETELLFILKPKKSGFRSSGA